jgi:hypothetical protein
VGYQLGRLIGILLVPVLLLAVIGFIQFWRTRDREQALRTALSWWAILLAFACFFLSIFAQAAQRLP